MPTTTSPALTRYIEAKHPGTCERCGTPISPGEWIIWTKGQPARHNVCHALISTTGRCHCGAGLNERGMCLDDFLFGSHRGGAA